MWLIAGVSFQFHVNRESKPLAGKRKRHPLAS
jgi:hypothetical protein